MKRVAIVQARMGSTRLPGKVLRDLAGRPMLAQQLRRLKQCRKVDDLVVATTESPEDGPVVRMADEEGVRWFRGSEQDVLARYVGAAREARADLVVRVTADCPLIDPEQTDRVIAAAEHHPGECDYAANIVRRTFPRGLDVEAFFIDTLERLNRLATASLAREHVTRFMLLEQPHLFLIRSVTDADDNSDLRWTVDTEDDFAAVHAIYRGLDLASRSASYREVLAFVRSRPDVVALNAGVGQKVV